MERIRQVTATAVEAARAVRNELVPIRVGTFEDFSAHVVPQAGTVVEGHPTWHIEGGTAARGVRLGIRLETRTSDGRRVVWDRLLRERPFGASETRLDELEQLVTADWMLQHFRDAGVATAMWGLHHESPQEISAMLVRAQAQGIEPLRFKRV